MIQDLLKVQLTKKFGYFCDVQHFKIITRIMADTTRTNQISQDNSQNYNSNFKIITRIKTYYQDTSDFQEFHTISETNLTHINKT